MFEKSVLIIPLSACATECTKYLQLKRFRTVELEEHLSFRALTLTALLADGASDSDDSDRVTEDSQTAEVGASRQKVGSLL